MAECAWCGDETRFAGLCEACAVRCNEVLSEREVAECTWHSLDWDWRYAHYGWERPEAKKSAPDLGRIKYGDYDPSAPVGTGGGVLIDKDGNVITAKEAVK